MPTSSVASAGAFVQMLATYPEGRHGVVCPRHCCRPGPGHCPAACATLPADWVTHQEWFLRPASPERSAWPLSPLRKPRTRAGGVQDLPVPRWGGHHRLAGRSCSIASSHFMTLISLSGFRKLVLDTSADHLPAVLCVVFAAALGLERSAVLRVVLSCRWAAAWNVRGRSYCWFDVPQSFNPFKKTANRERTIYASARFASKLACRPEERILRGLFCRLQHFADRPQLQTLVVLQLEYHALAGSQQSQCSLYALVQVLAPKLQLRIRACPVRRSDSPSDRSHRHWNPSPLTDLRDGSCGDGGASQAKIGHDAIQPRVKRAFKAEVRQVPVGLQECFLVYILRILLVAEHVQRQPQHCAVVSADQLGRRAPRWPCWACRISSSSSSRCCARASICAGVRAARARPTCCCLRHLRAILPRLRPAQTHPERQTCCRLPPSPIAS